MKILIAGAGSLGLRFGYMMSKHHQVMLASHWHEHIEYIKKNGMEITIDQAPAIHYPIDIDHVSDIKGIYDVIIFLTKASGLEAMIQDVLKNANEQTRVFCFLNGLGHEEILKRYFSDHQIHIGMTRWTAHLKGPGKVFIGSDGILVYKQLEEHLNEQKKYLDMFQKSGLKPVYSKDVMIDIWQKLAINCVLNPISSLLEMSDLTLGKHTQMDDLMTRIVQEVAYVASLEGVFIDAPKVIEQLEHIIHHATSDHYPSMYQDLKKGRKTEINVLNYAVARIAKKHHQSAPLNEMLSNLIQIKENEMLKKIT